MWNIVHVIMTDGKDEDSSFNIDEVVNVMKMFGNAKGKRLMKIIIIGIDATPTNEAVLTRITRAGG